MCAPLLTPPLTRFADTKCFLSRGLKSACVDADANKDVVKIALEEAWGSRDPTLVLEHQAFYSDVLRHAPMLELTVRYTLGWIQCCARVWMAGQLGCQQGVHCGAHDGVMIARGQE